MKKSVKTLASITICTLLSISSFAQLKLPGTSSITPEIRKVINDFPNRFRNLQGELIQKNPQSMEYECNFKVTGAEKVVVTQYSSQNNNVCSWEAVMLTTEEFPEAKKKFRSLYTQLNNLGVKFNHGANYQLKGRYETPAEEKDFTTIVFLIDQPDDYMKKLRVELKMYYELLNWKVKILIYEKEREDDERGEIYEG